MTCDTLICDVSARPVVVTICSCDVTGSVRVVTSLVRRLEEDTVVDDTVVISVGKVSIAVVFLSKGFVGKAVRRKFKT